LRLLNWTKDYLARAGLDEPRLAAEVLLAHVLGCQRIDLYTRFSYEPTPEQLDAFRQLVQRAHKLEPVAYLVGEKEFYSLRFKVTPDVLVPRAETEMLVAEAVSHLSRLGRPGRVWDACTGSGCIAVATASCVKDALVLATDISPSAIAMAEENAAVNKVADRVRCRVANLLTLPEDCADLKDFDVITANPPYVADNQMVTETVLHEPSIAVHAGPEGLDFIRPIVSDAPKFLAAGGILVMEYGYAQADDVRDLIVATGAFQEPRILKDVQGIERSTVAARK